MGMATTIERAEVRVTVGVDTHADVHVAAAIDQHGRLLGTISVPSTAAGHAQLTAWAQELGAVEQVGVEGTGSYGAGLTRHLLDQGISVVEAVRPNRQTRRRRGKTDAIGAETAARSVLAGTALGMPKTADGAVEMIRTLRLVRRSAMKARTQAANQLRAVLVTAPQALRDRLRALSLPQLVDAATRCRPGQLAGIEAASKLALKSLATRHQQLTAEITTLDTEIEQLAHQAAPQLMAIKGVGADTAGGAAGRRRRQPRTAAQRIRHRAPVRRRADPNVVRQDQPTPPQPRRQPRRQPRPLRAGAGPAQLRRTHPRIRHPAHRRRQDQTGDHPLHQAVYRPRSVQSADGLFRWRHRRGDLTCAW